MSGKAYAFRGSPERQSISGIVQTMAALRCRVRGVRSHGTLSTTNTKFYIMGQKHFRFLISFQYLQSTILMLNDSPFKCMLYFIRYPTISLLLSNNYTNTLYSYLADFKTCITNKDVLDLLYPSKC